MNSTDVIISYWDWLLCPFYLLIIFVVASRIKNRNIKINATYKYFLWGLFAKIFGAISLCLIYVYYYKEGGDTLHYHSSSVAFVNLFFQSPMNFFKVFFGGPTSENYSYFNQETGYPDFFVEQYEVNVSKLLVVLEIVALKSYIITSVFMAVVSYTGVWKLYQMFSQIYPNLRKSFAFAILFTPSVVFWGSGILKDSWTISACGWFCVSYYKIFFSRKSILKNSLFLFLASTILIIIKPYIFIALLPASLIWATWNKVVEIENLIIKILIIPVMFLFGAGSGFLIWSYVASYLGVYSSLDGMIQKAYASSEDLKQDYYQGNSFDLGDFDPTLQGLLSKAPQAITAGLFRPFIWEAKNIVMFLSGIENVIILSFCLYVLLKKPTTILSSLYFNPVVLFSLVFAIVFAFSVGISTSNFGALVRLRIPLLPFLLSGLIITHFRGAINNNKLK